MSGVAADHGDFRSEIDLLRLSVRLSLCEGTLSPIAPSRVGRGQGTPCPVCARVVSDDQLGYDVESDAGRVAVHIRCYLVWRHESEEIAQGPAARHAYVANRSTESRKGKDC